MPKLTIDDQLIEVPDGTPLIQACEMLGIEIPRFCYHERLAIAGNCRMCLVEVSPGPPKPQASCALPCAEGMVVKTHSPMVKKAREGVMEFLLINHPLDCPICDQAGECDLQDQALFYGKGTSRYREHKRAVEDKYMGPIVKTQMTRCIHCTRCIRFSADVAGVPELGAFGRGEHMEVSTYVEKAISSELSGNLVDLCPVGALTAKPYAFIARPWELTKTESIDVMDGLGSNIRIDTRGEAVLRILPRVHEDVNEEWISDKTRHACDGLRTQRLDRPYVRGRDGKLHEATWEEALALVAEQMKLLQPSEMAALAGNMVNVEAAYSLRDVMRARGVANLDCRQEGAKLPFVQRENYLFNSAIAGVEEADFILLVGVNPRREAAVLNARIRKRYLQGNLRVARIGAAAHLTYPVDELGNDARVLQQIFEGTHPISGALKEAKKPMIVLGMAALARNDGAQVWSVAHEIARTQMQREGWQSFNVLHHAAGRVGALDVGFVPGVGGRDIAGIIEGAQNGAIKLVYLLGVDEIDMALLGKAFVVYQGHHGDDGAHRADVIFPAAAYTEQDATFVNTEGRVQQARRAIFPPGQAREDWAIAAALAEQLRSPLPYRSLAELRGKLQQEYAHFANVDALPSARTIATMTLKAPPLEAMPFEEFLSNFYMTDPISRASKTMAECTREIWLPQMQALKAKAA